MCIRSIGEVGQDTALDVFGVLSDGKFLVRFRVNEIRVGINHDEIFPGRDELVQSLEVETIVEVQGKALSRIRDTSDSIDGLCI